MVIYNKHRPQNDWVKVWVKLPDTSSHQLEVAKEPSECVFTTMTKSVRLTLNINASKTQIINTSKLKPFAAKLSCYAQNGKVNLPCPQQHMERDGLWETRSQLESICTQNHRKSRKKLAVCRMLLHRGKPKNTERKRETGGGKSAEINTWKHLLPVLSWCFAPRSPELACPPSLRSSQPDKASSFTSHTLDPFHCTGIKHTCALAATHLAVAFDQLGDTVDVQHVAVQPPLVAQGGQLGLVLQSGHLGQQVLLPSVPPQPRGPGSLLKSGALLLQLVAHWAEGFQAAVPFSVLWRHREPASRLTDEPHNVSGLLLTLWLHVQPASRRVQGQRLLLCKWRRSQLRIVLIRRENFLFLLFVWFLPVLTKVTVSFACRDTLKRQYTKSFARGSAVQSAQLPAVTRGGRGVDDRGGALQLIQMQVRPVATSSEEACPCRKGGRLDCVLFLFSVCFIYI